MQARAISFEVCIKEVTVKNESLTKYRDVQ